MEKLRLMRDEMLALHKILMEKERGNYEIIHGPVTNIQLLNLLFENEKFSWLRDISILVAEIDEKLAAPGGVDKGMAKALFKQARSLFDDSKTHQKFKKKYRANLETESKITNQNERLLELLEIKKA